MLIIYYANDNIRYPDEDSDEYDEDSNEEEDSYSDSNEYEYDEDEEEPIIGFLNSLARLLGLLRRPR